MEKLKEIYKEPNVDIILFEFSDIVTTSGGGDDDERPNLGDMGDWST